MKVKKLNEAQQEDRNKMFMTTKTLDELLKSKVVYKLVKVVEIGPGFPRKQGTYLSLSRESYETEKEAEEEARELVEEYDYAKVYTVKCTTSYEQLNQFYLE